MSKENDLKFIKGFSKINIVAICKELNIDRGNLLNGRTSEKNTELVRKTIEERIKILADDDYELNQHIPRID